MSFFLLKIGFVDCFPVYLSFVLRIMLLGVCQLAASLEFALSFSSGVCFYCCLTFMFYLVSASVLTFKTG